MHDTRAFFPLYTPSSQNPSVAGTLEPSTTVAATDAASPSDRFAGTESNNFVQFQIANLSSSWAYVSFGVFGNVVPATVAESYPVGPGAVVVRSEERRVGKECRSRWE